MQQPRGFYQKKQEITKLAPESKQNLGICSAKNRTIRWQ
jgi:hypothetical protein